MTKPFTFFIFLIYTSTSFAMFKPEKYEPIATVATNYRNAANELFLSDKKKPAYGSFTILQMIKNLETMSLYYTGKIKNHILDNIEYLKSVKIFNDKKHLMPTSGSLDFWIGRQLRIINFYSAIKYKRLKTVTERKRFRISRIFVDNEIARKFRAKTIRIFKANLTEEDHMKREETIISFELFIHATEDDPVDTSLCVQPPSPNLSPSCREWTSFMERMGSESSNKHPLTFLEMQSHLLSNQSLEKA